MPAATPGWDRRRVLILSDAHVFQIRQHLGGKGLLDFDQINLFDAETGFFKGTVYGLGNCGKGPAGVIARHCE